MVWGWLVHNSSCTTAEEGIRMGTSSAVSSLAKEVTCSSSDGTVVSSDGAGEGNYGCTGAGGTAGVTGEGSSSLTREAGGPRWLDTTTEGGTA